MKKILFLVSLFLCFSCGYRLVGSGSIPGGVKSVYVDIFRNDSGYSGADIYLNEKFVSELSKYVRVTEKSRADAFLTGKILSLHLSTASKISSTKGYERRLTMTVNVSLISREDGKVLFERKNMSEDHVFNVSSGSDSGFSVPRDALQELSDKIAKKISSLIMSDF